MVIARQIHKEDQIFWLYDIYRIKIDWEAYRRKEGRPYIPGEKLQYGVYEQDLLEALGDMIRDRRYKGRIYDWWHYPHSQRHLFP